MRNIGDKVWVVDGYRILRAEITKILINKKGPIHYFEIDGYPFEKAEVSFGDRAGLHDTLDEAIQVVTDKLSRCFFSDM